MRPRKRANWPVLVYRYWVAPEYDTWERLPLAIQREAEAMRALWNQLGVAFAQRQASYYDSVPERLSEKPEVIAGPSTTLGINSAKQSLPEKETASTLTAPRNDTTPRTSRTASEKPSPLALRQIQKTFLQTTQAVSKASVVTWANKQFVTTQFFAALTRYFKKQGDPPRQRHGEFREVHFQHRFTEGGLPIERIFGHSQRLCLTPVAAEAFSPTLSQRQQKRLARTQGTFQVNGCLVHFRTILHRPLPSGAYLKVAALIGKRTTPSGYLMNSTGGHFTPARWDWSLQLTLEVPPSQIASEKQGNQVIASAAKQSLPEKEIASSPPAPRNDTCLPPFQIASQPITVQECNATAALLVRCKLVDGHQLSFAILTDPTGREETLFLPEAILDSWYHKRSLHKQAERLLETTKQQLQELPLTEQSSGTQQRFAHLKTASAPGLWRLLHALEEEDSATPALQILHHWASCSTKLLREARGVEQHYLGHRDWFYHNLALQLCHRYQQLVITVPETGGVYTQERPPSASGTDRTSLYHHLAAPARFVSFLHQAAGKTGATVQEEANFATRWAFRAAKSTREQTQFSGDKAETIAQSSQRQ